ncbi:MAG: zf-HC2 domain-containing protein [Gemmatimonadetes bacterium]|nr:zf-HC2 domain-containing protein [Gemmatimonadota bacterium]
MTKNEIRSCEDALRLLAAYIDRELPGPTDAKVEHHLETCRSCYSRAEFEKRLKASLAELGSEPVRPALAERVNTLIRTFSVAGGD